MDDLGRVVIPMELRRTLGINTKDGLEIFVTGDSIVLKKYQPACACGNVEDLTDHKGTPICHECIDELYKRTAQMLVSSKAIK